MVYNKLKDWYGWLLPNECLLCRQSIAANRDFCELCEQALPYLNHGCIRCAAALGGNKRSTICGTCLKRPPAFQQSHALFTYETPINKLIQQLKYQKRLDLAAALGRLLAQHLSQCNAARPDLLLPVPLHRQRLRQRGFNQALELARPLASAMGIMLDPWIAIRHRNTVPQTGLPPQQRGRNVRNAFQLQKDVSGLKIAVIDDVMTTGHTVNALASSLVRGGAAKVDIWVLARA